MISFVVLKPHFIYDHNKKQYKEFGNSNDKTLLSLPVMAIVVAIIMGIIFCNINKKTHIGYFPDTSHLTKYIHVYPQSYFKPNLVQQ